MEEQNILQIQTRNEFRQWLETHHATEKACWVGVKRGRGQSSSHSRPCISASAPTTWPIIRKGIL